MLRRRMARQREATELDPVLDADALLRAQRTVEQVEVEDSVAGYCVDLAAATRTRPQVLVGASPRGALALLLVARALAVLRRRDYVTPEDVKAVALAVLGAPDHAASRRCGCAGCRRRTWSGRCSARCRRRRRRCAPRCRRAEPWLSLRSRTGAAHPRRDAPPAARRRERGRRPGGAGGSREHAGGDGPTAEPSWRPTAALARAVVLGAGAAAARGAAAPGRPGRAGRAAGARRGARARRPADRRAGDPAARARGRAARGRPGHGRREP